MSMRKLPKRQAYRPAVGIKTPHLKPKRSLGQIFAILVVLVALLSSAYFVLLSGYFNIKDVTVVGNNKVSYNQVSEIVNKTITSGSPIQKIFNQNVLFAKTSNIASEIKTNLPLVESIKIKRELPGKLVVKIREREPVLAWQTGANLYVIDREGIALEQVAETNFPRIVDEKAIPVNVSAAVVSPKFTAFVLEVLANFEAKTGLKITALSVAESTFDLKAQTTKGFYVLFDTTKTPGIQVDNAKRAIDDSDAKKKRIFEYVDVRIIGKVFYK